MVRPAAPNGRAAPAVATNPAELAAQLVAAERGLADPNGSPLDDADWGHVHQVAIRKLGYERNWDVEVFEALPPDLQSIVEVACKAANMDMFAEFEARNGEAIKTLVEEHGVELRPFPDEVLAELKAASLEVREEMAAADEMSGKAWASLKAYMERVKLSTKIGSQYFVERR